MVVDNTPVRGIRHEMFTSTAAQRNFMDSESPAQFGTAVEASDAVDRCNFIPNTGTIETKSEFGADGSAWRPAVGSTVRSTRPEAPPSYRSAGGDGR